MDCAAILTHTNQPFINFLCPFRCDTTKHAHHKGCEWQAYLPAAKCRIVGKKSWPLFASSNITTILLSLKSFTFNPFQENTYLLIDDISKECILFDPGCSNSAEEQELKSFIESAGLKPTHLVNTHCHIDHILGNHFVASTWNLPLHLHRNELMTMQQSSLWGQSMGMDPGLPVSQHIYIDEGDTLPLGGEKIEMLFTPGHSVASLSFYHKKQNLLIAGDVLFRQSIGRTDLPGGDFETLANSIRMKLYTLPDETLVYPGHGPHTTVGFEKLNNPFVMS